MTNLTITLRKFANGDETVLREIFHGAVHHLAASHYDEAQRNAWAPALYDADAWGSRLRHNQPFVAEIGGVPAGFADLQPDGLIDHFFVAREFAGCGVAKALMRQIDDSAAARGIPTLYADVSLAAQPFFLRCGYRMVRRQQVQRAGVTLENARMEKEMSCGSGPQ